MNLNELDKNKSGIYCICNKINNKVYIGKSKNIYNRIKQHIYYLNHKDKNENCYLINAWLKYGSDNFYYYVIEYLPLDEQLLKNKELYWILKYNALDKKYGYNLRLDSESKMIVHESTKLKLHYASLGEKNPNYNHKWTKEMKQKMSDIKKEQYKLGLQKINYDAIQKGIKNKFEKWKNNPELKQQMIEKVRTKNTKYIIKQYDKNTNKFIKEYKCVNDILIENPTYKKHNIYAVCSGEKKSMYGYIWIKEKIQ